MRKRRRSRYDGKKLQWLHDGRRFLLLIVVLLLIFRLFAGFSFINGRSMMDTFQNGDIVLYTRLFKEVRKGDIVSVAIPSGSYYIKRVVATEGDEIDIRDGTMYINDVAEEGDYIRTATYPEDAPFTYPYTIEEGCVFVVGDNREESIDSRYFGAVSTRQVRGIIKLRAGWLYAELL